MVNNDTLSTVRGIQRLVVKGADILHLIYFVWRVSPNTEFPLLHTFYKIISQARVLPVSQSSLPTVTGTDVNLETTTRA